MWGEIIVCEKQHKRVADERKMWNNCVQVWGGGGPGATSPFGIFAKQERRYDSSVSGGGESTHAEGAQRMMQNSTPVEQENGRGSGGALEHTVAELPSAAAEHSAAELH